MPKNLKIIFVTGNKHKIQEVNQIFKTLEKGHQIPSILGLQDIAFEGEIPETAATFHGNALQKAQFIYNKYKMPCFAEDSGLEVDALNGAPGVYSARYAGRHKNHNDNIDLLLHRLQNIEDRSARFKAVIACIIQDQIHYFEGTIEGSILQKRKGDGGFGYDPIFQPTGYYKSFAEMNDQQKNQISHRAQAMTKLIRFLNFIARGLQ
jgi:XTP/dITP diphosphohydrolase